MNHLKSITRTQPALASAGTQKDPILVMGFVIDVLTAVNSLIIRKNPTTT